MYPLDLNVFPAREGEESPSLGPTHPLQVTFLGFFFPSLKKEKTVCQRGGRIPLP